MDTRKIALDCLKQVRIDKKYANLVLRETLQQMDIKDRAWVTQVVYGTLRNYRHIRFQWETLAQTPVDDNTALLLDMAIYQLFMMKTPDYAVVNEMVELAVKSKKGLVNAILRRVIDQGLMQSDKIEIRTSHPDWLYRLWVSHYGKEQADKICEENTKEAIVHGRINTLKTSKSEVEQIDGVTFLDDYAFIADFNIIQHPIFKEGMVVVQDISSQQVVSYLDVQPNQVVLDCCAAPGTKTSQLGMMMKNQGRIVAGDIHPHRVKLLDEAMKKLGVEIVEGQVWDATKISNDLEKESFDRILVDVPCSGFGVLKRKPEIKWNSSPQEIDELIHIQQDILTSVSQLLKPQGIMVYSTCTLNKKENERQIEKFLKENEQFQCVEEKTIFPYDGHGDGFYIAKIVKK
ncbi:MAG: 16S rRNA (cytosine(967)-C(5))-methyltransferase RsmB [Anaerorhabdus sp.]